MKLPILTHRAFLYCQNATSQTPRVLDDLHAYSLAHPKPDSGLGTVDVPDTIKLNLENVGWGLGSREMNPKS